MQRVCCDRLKTEVSTIALLHREHPPNCSIAEFGGILLNVARGKPATIQHDSPHTSMQFIGASSVMLCSAVILVTRGSWTYVVPQHHRI